MKYKLLIFDLDGTIADTSPGIINSHKHANVSMGRQVPDKSVLMSVIGGPLLDTYRTKFKYSDTEAVEAVRIYREYYKERGINEATLYGGMSAALEELKARGYLLAVATLKAEKFAIPMLQSLGIAKYFDLIHGVDENDTRNKASLIELCMSELGISREKSILIGDSAHDANGAASAHIDFLAALYGFGFNSREEADKYQPLYVIEKPLDLLEIF